MLSWLYDIFTTIVTFLLSFFTSQKKMVRFEDDQLDLEKQEITVETTEEKINENDKKLE
jgi:hypothetical protein